MSPMEGGAMPRPSEAAKAAFLTLLPGDPTVTSRPMFGNIAAFVQGNMFAGLFGEDLFVRLSDQQAAQALRAGGREFQPMPGRAMKGYVVVPAGWQDEPAAAQGWIDRSLEWTRAMPAKEASSRKTKKKS